MTSQEAVLLQKIEAYDLDNKASTAPFSKRLAHKYAWTTRYTEKAIREYKRFIFLWIVTQGKVMPSTIIEEIWQFHLTYTRDYWEEWCAKILETKVHHQPLQQIAKNKGSLKNGYIETLAHYQTYFEKKPPLAVWELSRRYLKRASFKKVDKNKYVLVNKKNVFNVGCTTFIPIFLVTAYLLIIGIEVGFKAFFNTWLGG